MDLSRLSLNRRRQGLHIAGTFHRTEPRIFQHKRRLPSYWLVGEIYWLLITSQYHRSNSNFVGIIDWKARSGWRSHGMETYRGCPNYFQVSLLIRRGMHRYQWILLRLTPFDDVMSESGSLVATDMNSVSNNQKNLMNTLSWKVIPVHRTSLVLAPIKLSLRRMRPSFSNSGPSTEVV